MQLWAVLFVLTIASTLYMYPTFSAPSSGVLKTLL